MEFLGANQAVDQKQSLLQQQSKKWQRHERKQHGELETKLALVMCSLQIPAHKLNDPFLRDFLETAQPKFQLSPNGEPMEQILIQMHSRAITNMKISLASASKFTLMINTITSSDDKSSDGPIFLTISVAYFSQAQQKVECILLAIRRAVSIQVT